MNGEAGARRSCLFFVLLMGLLISPNWAQESPAKKATDERPLVVLETSAGNISIELYPKLAPITVENFLQYVDDGFYNGLVFHRVIPGRLVQTGLVDPDLNRRESRGKIKSESDNGLMNDIGTISMHRPSMLVHSATSEFFINLKNNDKFNRRGPTAALAGFTVFGRVIEGLEVAKHIGAVRSEPRGEFTRFPLDPTTLIRAYRVEAASDAKP